MYLATGSASAFWLAIQLLELGLRHDPAGVVHVAVPEPAELGAADVEGARPLELEVDDVVDARVGVGLDAELVGPEGVDDVERGDVEADQLVGGENELRRSRRRRSSGSGR